ncbi:MAG: hypothetical protein A2521_11250 [Deltaproteobacteria bacterium RIFOXYD12_FULL_57_12]|nr:MAG: hypothetical protein A2521_11250 [Deltaproteobacteria bacterium RIFOXYD12_FULL_57_12]
MGIQSSMYSGISGLATNGNAMSVIGNNIANTNTVGFKASRSVFSDLLSSSVSGSGGISQVGRGVGLASIDNIFSQGTFESTESSTDLAIEGSGFFMLRVPNDQEIFYSRAGAFNFDQDGNLINPEGYTVQGYYLDANGNTVGDITDIAVETQGYTPATATTNIILSTNLNSKSPYLGGFDITDPAGTANYATSIRVYDSFGDTHLMTNYFVKMDPATNPLEWEVHTVVASSDLKTPGPDALTEIGSGALVFGVDGVLTAPVNLTTTAGALDWFNEADPSTQVTFDMQTTQYASDSVVNSQTQNGYAAGTLVKLDIDAAGIIYGKYSNGEPRALARLALSSFNNPGGLNKEGSNMFRATSLSGPPIVGTVGSGVGKLFTNSLEQSNVDLAQEFVRMITIQRGFQANSKIITTTDEMMNDLINLKR